MRYALSYNEAAARYLRELSLTREGRLRLNAALRTVEVLPDSFRLDPVYRVCADRFQFDYIFRDGSRPRVLTLIVDDSGAAYGVLKVVWADCNP